MYHLLPKLPTYLFSVPVPSRVHGLSKKDCGLHRSQEVVRWITEGCQAADTTEESVSDKGYEKSGSEKNSK